LISPPSLFDDIYDVPPSLGWPRATTRQCYIDSMFAVKRRSSFNRARLARDWDASAACLVMKPKGPNMTYAVPSRYGVSKLYLTRLPKVRPSRLFDTAGSRRALQGSKWSATTAKFARENYLRFPMGFSQAPASTLLKHSKWRGKGWLLTGKSKTSLTLDGGI